MTPDINHAQSRPWWARAWIWAGSLVVVSVASGFALTSAAAAAAGGCGGG